MKNINKLQLILSTCKFLKPKLYKKMVLTGRLYEYLINYLEEIEEEKKAHEEKKHYTDAAYLCNIGFLGIDEFLNIERFHKSGNIELIKNHVLLSVDYLENIEFREVAKIVALHHELPNGMGYFKIQQQDKFISYMNIADEFIDLTVDYYKNTPLLNSKGAYKLIHAKYKNNNLIQREELAEIEKHLNQFYERFILNV